jgi:hypothetical protein
MQKVLAILTLNLAMSAVRPADLVFLNWTICGFKRYSLDTILDL